MTVSVSEKKYFGSYDSAELDYLKPNAKPYTCISLFTGCGGFDLGTSQAGFETRVMIEWDKAACDTLRANWTKEGWEKHGGGKLPPWYHKREPVIIQEDVREVSSERILEAADLRVGECTLLTGGFPCQGFSTANNKRGMHDERNFLYLECVRIIRDTMPKTFALENVPGLASMENGAVIRMICEDLADSGYNVSWDKLNAADYGVPQNRIRIFVMGKRVDIAAIGNSRIQYHIGGLKGCITHPRWFIQKYPDLAQQKLPL